MRIIQKFMTDQYRVYHQYLVNKKPINPVKQRVYGNLLVAQQENLSVSTIYKCRKVSHDPQRDNSNFYALKVISYKKGKKIGKAIYNEHTKNYQQIKTEFQVLKILQKCHRVAQLKQMINQNTKRKDDQQFFYDFLGKPQTPGEKYICFVTEFCSQGNLNAIIQKKKSGVSEDQIISYGAQIIQGLIQLKKKKVIHRDLRLCNIFLHNNQIKFSDFDTAFIGGISTYKDVKNGIDNNTAPPQIIDLSSMSDEQLKKFDSDKLYHLQQKSDIYFFGLALYKMIFGVDCRELGEENLINEITSKIVDQHFNPQLLSIMKDCLEENADKRIDLLNLIERFSILEKAKYFGSRTLNRLYLSEEPLIFVSHKISQLDPEILAKIDNKYTSVSQHLNKLQNIDFDKALKKNTDNHLTSHFANFFIYKNITNLHQFWKLKQKEKKQEQTKFLESMEEFIRNIGARSFYYECLYKTILNINMRSIRDRSMHHLVRQSKKILEKQITNVLTFLFKLLLEQPFKEDKYYSTQNLPYEGRRLFNTILKSDILQNKKDCYSGKAKQFDEATTVTLQKIRKFYNFEYDKSQSFELIYQNFLVIMNQIDQKVKILLKDIIIKLGLAYQNVNKINQVGNIKQILFILIILEEQNLKKLLKNQIMIIWKLLTPLLNQQIQLQTYEAQVFFRQHKKINPEIQNKANQQCNLFSTTFFVINSASSLGSNQQISKDRHNLSNSIQQKAHTPIKKQNTNQNHSSNKLKKLLSPASNKDIEGMVKISVSEIGENKQNYSLQQRLQVDDQIENDAEKFILSLNNNSIYHFNEKDGNCLENTMPKK